MQLQGVELQNRWLGKIAYSKPAGHGFCVKKSWCEKKLVCVKACCV